MAAAVTGAGTWHAEATTPGAVEAALRGMLAERHRASDSYAPARVLNLVVVVASGDREAVVERLAEVKRYHPSRLLICSVTSGRTTLDAQASVGAEDETPEPGVLSVLRERVLLEIGEQHLPALDSIVDPLLVPELPTVVWAPGGSTEATDRLCRLADVVLVDSGEPADVDAALAREAELASHTYVVDLAWLRSTPWRERIAAAFDPAPLRAWLASVTAVEVRHRTGSEASALLFCGWLASRLGWTVSEEGRVRAGAADVEIGLQAVEMDAPGLCGVTVRTARGESIALDRAAGGLHVRRRHPDGREQTWAALGASRGEPGILGEGVRQALLRDPTYRPALAAARALAAAA